MTKVEIGIRKMLESKLCRPKLASCLRFLINDFPEYSLHADSTGQLYMQNKKTKIGAMMLYTVNDLMLDSIQVAQIIGMGQADFKPIGDSIHNLN